MKINRGDILEWDRSLMVGGKSSGVALGVVDEDGCELIAVDCESVAAFSKSMADFDVSGVKPEKLTKLKALKN